MPTQRKIDTVADLTDKLSRTQFTVVADYRGLTVAEISDLRKKLRETGAELIVAKNTLTLIAAIVGVRLSGGVMLMLDRRFPPERQKLLLFESAARYLVYAGNVSGFRRGPGDTVIINTNARDYYEFRTQPYCANRLNWEHRIALRSRGGSFICSGYDAEMYVPDSVGSAYCPLYGMRKLTPAEVTALRSQRR